MGPEEDPRGEGGPSGADTGSAGDNAGGDPSQPEKRAEDHPEASTSPRPSEEAGDQPSQPSSAGSMRFQDPATARPRPPTVGETRAREKAERKRKELEKAQFEANVKRYHRNQRLKGGAAVVGVVGVVAALGYWALSPRTTTAQCVQEDAMGGPIIVPDSSCTGHGGGTGGLFIYSGHQYRYYYGSSGGVGARPSGGTTIAPKGTTVKTSSGTTIQRGGLGSKFSGSGGG
ncbi:MAG: hypothetical protein QOD36_3049 [Mycobacterium sp.]|nr:hypothetical protein [Mycobacterium sp.]